MIRWISERLGTCAYDELPSGDFTIVDVRHLVDKGGNSPQQIVESIQHGVTAWKAGRTVVVACDFGISRSNGIAAGILSRTAGISFDKALSAVIAATGEQDIKLDVVETIRAALEPSLRPLDPNAVLVTGGTGFIGRYLVPHLEKRDSVLTPPRIELDLLAGSVALGRFCSAHGISDIVHLAYPRLYTNNDAIGSSVSMLRNVLDICRTLGIRLVFVSSAVIYAGYNSTSLWADESTPLRPKGNYSDAKYLEEMLVDAYLQRGELEAAICRFSPIYGKGGDRPRLIKTFAGRMQRGESVQTHLFRNGRPALDLLHVTDAAEALSLVVGTKGSGVYNFGTGKLTSTHDIAKLIGSIMNCKFEHGEMEINDYTSNIAMNSTKALKEWGWSPRIDVETGLRDMLVRA